MKLEQLLRQEHSKKQRDLIVKWIGVDRNRFAGLMRLFFSGEYRLTQRAAWPLSYCVKGHPDLIRPYLSRLVQQLHTDGLHDAVVRNSLRLLEEIEIPGTYRGRVMDLCFRFLESPEKAIAIKVFSLGILRKLSRDYPEIIPEVRLLIEAQWEHATPGFRSRAKAFLKTAAQAG